MLVPLRPVAKSRGRSRSTAWFIVLSSAFSCLASCTEATLSSAGGDGAEDAPSDPASPVDSAETGPGTDRGGATDPSADPASDSAADFNRIDPTTPDAPADPAADLLADPTADHADLSPENDTADEGAAPDPEPDPDVPVNPGECTVGAGTGGPCRTECLGVECGTILPDNCGGILDCGECRPGEEYCVRIDPRFVGQVRGAIADTMAGHPEYFDLGDCLSDTSCAVLDFEGMRSAIVANLNGRGVSCIAEGSEEIRVRDDADEAENYDIITSAGYSNAHYTSTCCPAIF